MKKHIVLFITTTLLFAGTSIFYACTQEDPTENLETLVELDNFEEDIQAVFKLINQDLEHLKSGRKLQPKARFFQAVTQVFPGSTTEESFQQNFTTAIAPTNGIQKDIAPNYLEILIKQFEDAAQGIQFLEASIQSGAYSLEQKQELIVLKETLKFFELNNSVLSEYINHSRAQNNKAIPKCGWWESWGKCAAGIIGGAGAGAGTGCWAGASSGVILGPPGSGAGCATGAIIGGLAGALTGAVSACDGCDD